MRSIYKTCMAHLYNQYCPSDRSMSQNCAEKNPFREQDRPTDSKQAAAHIRCALRPFLCLLSREVRARRASRNLWEGPKGLLPFHLKACEEGSSTVL